jgi:hypothetical protein
LDPKRERTPSENSVRRSHSQRGILNALDHGGDTHGYSARLKLASLRRESSNQLLDTLKEWSNYLERDAPIIRVGKVAIDPQARTRAAAHTLVAHRRHHRPRKTNHLNRIS